jgi:hypothetical protein
MPRDTEPVRKAFSRHQQIADHRQRASVFEQHGGSAIAQRQYRAEFKFRIDFSRYAMQFAGRA